MAGVLIQNYAFVNSDGTLGMKGQIEADSGASVLLTVSVIDGLTLGTGTASLTGTGSFQNWSIDVTPLAGTWQSGSAIAVGVLLDSTNVQIGYAEQGVTVYGS
jgi:hypothetical protein